jgi:membrane protease YdiL (CAAX protease family)
MTAFIRRHPATSYFTLAFLLSWAAVFSVIWPGPIPAPPDEAERRFPFVYLAMLIGPPVAGLAMTSVVAGREGLSAYVARLVKWRVGVRWYVIAAATAPVTLFGTLFGLAPWSRDFLPAVLSSTPSAPIQTPSATSFLLVAVLVGLGAGFFEELGWTGFAIPTIRRRFGVEATGMIVGVSWGAWHFLAILWGSQRAFGSASVTLYMIVALFSFLPPYRILMARVYESTHSLPVAILMHASLTTSMIIASPSAVGNRAIVYNLVFGGALWSIILILRIQTSNEHTRSRHAPPSPRTRELGVRSGAH